MHWYEHAFDDVCRLNVSFMSNCMLYMIFLIFMMPSYHDWVVALF